MDPPSGSRFISYAQNSEDVLLNRVCHNLNAGLYVDIGAFDPVIGSLTKASYDRGGSWIRCKPGSGLPKRLAERPRDINLPIAVLDRPGEVDFIEGLDEPAL